MSSSHRAHTNLYNLKYAAGRPLCTFCFSSHRASVSQTYASDIIGSTHFVHVSFGTFVLFLGETTSTAHSLQMNGLLSIFEIGMRATDAYCRQHVCIPIALCVADNNSAQKLINVFRVCALYPLREHTRTFAIAHTPETWQRNKGKSRVKRAQIITYSHCELNEKYENK